MILPLSRKNLSLEFQTRSDTNQAVQLLRLGRGIREAMSIFHQQESKSLISLLGGA